MKNVISITNAETAKKTEEDRYDSVKAESSGIHIISSTRNARRLYTDSGTGANQDLSIFEAHLRVIIANAGAE